MKSVLLAQLVEQNKRIHRLKPATDFAFLQASFFLMADLIQQLLLVDPQNSIYSQSSQIMTQYASQDLIALKELNKKTKRRNKPTTENIKAYDTALEDFLEKLTAITSNNSKRIAYPL